VQIGLICSEKQAIDATLRSLAREDARFCPVADRYWNARGGSHTDGGAFIFTVADDGQGGKTLACTDKFGRAVTIEAARGVRCDRVEAKPLPPAVADPMRALIADSLAQGDAGKLFDYALGMPFWAPEQLQQFCDEVIRAAAEPVAHATAIQALTLLLDRRYDVGDKQRSTVLVVLDQALTRLFDAAPRFGDASTRQHRRIDWATRDRLAAPRPREELLIIDAEKFPPEGDHCDAVLLRQAYQLGWRRFIVYRLRGQRFTGVGLGPNTDNVRIDVYGSSGDYLASGIDGLTITVHGNAQDQLAQILKRGKLVIHGDFGQTFMYGAKGGEVYVRGNGAGRPLINAVGRPRVVINGTCLDFLAESFMAGDPLNGGGFVILNGVEFDDHGRLTEQATPYPGSNLFSLASGGAIYIRDPHKKVVEGQLNGGEFVAVTDKDWRLIRAYLEENERLFGIKVDDLLTVDGERRTPQEVYRKVSAVKLQVLAAATEKKK
jgi:glutamate synthase domain-containing protein 3